MPHITIDGRLIEAEEGQTIIEAAMHSGINIPHFCWHPGLSIAGNCRMCLVEVGMPKRDQNGNPEVDEQGQVLVNYFPKLQIACSTTVADGMHVRLAHDRTVHAQEAVMEFLLINHPLDCPICDEAGQCKLQEYGLHHSKGESRFDEEKQHKDKRRPLGPNVLFDGERCISCSRCIRYADEVAGQPALTFAQRGDKVTIETFPGTEFDSPYSMNVIDICPVGALTSPDFRFKARVWDMSFNDSICTGCSRGCNIQVGVRNNEILRLEPRTNMHVNEYWMCDHGRLTQYHYVNESRIDKPLVRNTAGELHEAEWADAIAAAATRLKGIQPQYIMVLASALTSNENNYALAKFARTVLKADNIDFIRHEDPGFGDAKLRRSDRTPNSAGVQALGLAAQNGSVKAADLVKSIEQGRVKALYVMEDDLAALGPDAVAALDKLDVLIVHAWNHNATTEKADVVFSAATYAELEGTYTNCNGRVQHVEPALVTTENERYMGLKMSRLDKFGAHNDRWTKGPRRNCRQSWKVLSLLAKHMTGEDWQIYKSEQVFDEIAQSVEGFKGIDYALLKERRGVGLGKAGEPDPIVVEYNSHDLKPN